MLYPWFVAFIILVMGGFSGTLVTCCSYASYKMVYYKVMATQYTRVYRSNKRKGTGYYPGIIYTLQAITAPDGIPGNDTIDKVTYYDDTTLYYDGSVPPVLPQHEKFIGTAGYLQKPLLQVA